MKKFVFLFLASVSLACMSCAKYIQNYRTSDNETRFITAIPQKQMVEYTYTNTPSGGTLTTKTTKVIDSQKNTADITTKTVSAKMDNLEKSNDGQVSFTINGVKYIYTKEQAAKDSAKQ